MVTKTPEPAQEDNKASRPNREERSWWDRAQDDYLTRSAQPLQSLVFLLPLLLAYEMGTLLFTANVDHGSLQTIKARGLILDFFRTGLGDLGYYLPGILMIVVLLGMHIYQGLKWRVYPWMTIGMLAESIALTMPLLVFGVWWMGVSAGGVAAGGDAWKAELVFSVGAGLYEELLFRVVGVGVPVMILMRWLKVDVYTAAGLAVTISGGLFAMYHFNSSNPFTTRKFIYYTLAGIYFGVMYLWRGFGIAAASHAFYDVLVVAHRYGLLTFTSDE